MLSTIIDIFNSSAYDYLDKEEWIEITKLLMDNIDVENYTILKYKQNYNNTLIIGNVIDHKESHSHSVVYINEEYKLRKVENSKRVVIKYLYPYCIDMLWKSNIITTSFFEDKLYYIFSFVLENIYEINNDLVENWLDVFYYMKKKSINDVLQKYIWEIYDQIFSIVKPVFVDHDTLYFDKDAWSNNSKMLLNKIYEITDDISVVTVNIIPQDEKQILEFELI